VTVVAPLVGGVVADFERTKEMLTRFVRQARSGVTSFSRRALVGVVSGITTVEQRALLAVAEQAKIGRVGMIEEGLAAAIGAGVKVSDERASFVVDIGAGTTNVAAVVGCTIVHARAERIGSSDINAAISNHIRRHRGLAIGVQTAERLKIDLASATLPLDLARTVTVKGRDVQTGGPAAIEITAGEIYPVAAFVVRKIGDVIEQTLTELSPEVAADIYDRGIILTGGGAQLNGMEEYLRERTKFSVESADEPQYAVVRGLAQMLDEPLTLRRLLRSEAHPLLSGEAGLAET
jgi:rod shape-determining protein MreB